MDRRAPPRRDWQWCTTEYTIPQLRALLHHPEHPARLVVEGSIKTKLLYIHVWNDVHATYERTARVCLGRRVTATGLMHVFPHFRYSVSDLTEDEQRFFGDGSAGSGELNDWALTQVAMDPIHYLSEDGMFLTRPPFDNNVAVRKGILLGTPAIRPPNGLTLGVRPCNTTGLPDLRISDVENPDESIYEYPRGDGDHLAAWARRQTNPCNWVSPRSVNDCHFTILGFILDGFRLRLSTSVKHIARHEIGGPAPARPIPEPAAAVVVPRRMKPPPVVQDSPAQDDAHDCKICMVNAANMLVAPCEHASLCNSCARQIAATPRPQCPFCRADIEHIFRVRMM